jgi:PAS domain S-box-containing protein
MTSDPPDLNLEHLGVGAILDALSDGVYVTDTGRKIIAWNQAAEKITGWKREEVVGRSCWDDILVHIDKDDHALCGHEFCPLHRAIVTGKRSVASLMVFAKNRAGARIPVEVTVSPLWDASGRIVGGIEIFRDLGAMVRDLDRARIIQAHALESPLPEDGRLRFGIRYVPQELVGGDFYRVERIDADRYAVMVADVVGHGITSALFVMQIRSLWEEKRAALGNPARFMSQLGAQLNVLCSRDDYFATAVYAVIDAAAGTFEYVNGGHPAPLIARGGGGFDRLEASGPMLGFAEDCTYTAAGGRLERGDTLLLYTDGATEVFDARERELSEQGFMDLLAKEDLSKGESALKGVEERLLTYCNQLRLPDDLTLISIHAPRPSG